MRHAASRSRLVVRAGGVVLLWLLSVAASEAAHAPRHARRVCDPQKTTLRKVQRQHKSVAGPLAQPSARARAGLTDPTRRLGRVARFTLNVDDEAIQNDAPAAHAAVDPILAPETLGEFVAVSEQDATTRTFCPRSPRGPPPPA